MILKPFMLRRIKKDVENELSDKVHSHTLTLAFTHTLTLTLRGFHLYHSDPHPLTSLSSPDRDLDIVPADEQTEAPLPGSEEQDLHRGPAAVVHGHGTASSQHHQQPHEPRHAVPKGPSFVGLID